jgi:Transposase IS66 family
MALRPRRGARGYPGRTRRRPRAEGSAGTLQVSPLASVQTSGPSHILQYIQPDETPIGVQSQPTKGHNHQGYEFQYGRPGGPVVFDFCMSRAREAPAEFLRDYGGILQCDGYQGYQKIGASGMIRAGCRAHVRRKFNEALKLDPQDREAAGVLLLMGKLLPWKRKLVRPGLPRTSV